MILRKWEDLPGNMKNESVRRYYESLNKKRFTLLAKRIFDLLVAIIALIIISPLILILSIAIKMDSKGPVFFLQTRVTQYGKKFKIFKFRTMKNNADKMGIQLTTKNDVRITRIGKYLRKLKLDEIPQLINIILGDMSFVGTRPEVSKYVDRYTDEMLATLLLPAGVTSEASIRYKNEEYLLSNAENADEVYVHELLPEKMKYNLRSIEEFNFFSDIKIMLMTLITVVKRDSEEKDIFEILATDKASNVYYGRFNFNNNTHI